MLTLIIITAAATLLLVVLIIAWFRSCAGGADNVDTDDIPPEDKARAALLEELVAGYKEARDRGCRGGLYMCAASHCIQLLQAGCEIDEGAARLALRGLKGDAELEKLVSEKIGGRKTIAEAGE